MKIPDYTHLYKEHYKKLPNFYFWVSLVISLVITDVVPIIWISGVEDPRIYITLIVILATPISIGIAFWVRWMSAIILSQSIVVADVLLSMNNRSSEEIVLDDELPDL